MVKKATARIVKKARVQSPTEDEGLKWSWSWRSLAAVVYLVICLADFLVMPVYREYIYTKMSVPQMVQLAMKLEDGAAQIEALKILKEDRSWTPITNDMFHLSFGAILGVAALPMARDRLNRNRRRRYDEYEDEGDFGGDFEGDMGDSEGDFPPDLPMPRGGM